MSDSKTPRFNDWHLTADVYWLPSAERLLIDFLVQVIEPSFFAFFGSSKKLFFRYSEQIDGDIIPVNILRSFFFLNKFHGFD